jgi:hypothetical protein
MGCGGPACLAGRRGCNELPAGRLVHQRCQLATDVRVDHRAVGRRLVLDRGHGPRGARCVRNPTAAA